MKTILVAMTLMLGFTSFGQIEKVDTFLNCSSQGAIFDWVFDVNQDGVWDLVIDKNSSNASLKINGYSGDVIRDSSLSSYALEASCVGYVDENSSWDASFGYFINVSYEIPAGNYRVPFRVLGYNSNTSNMEYKYGVLKLNFNNWFNFQVTGYYINHTWGEGLSCDDSVNDSIIVSQSAPVYTTDTQVACDSYTWIDGNTYTSSNNTATWVGQTVSGADSIVTLNLIVNQPSYTTIVETSCDEFTFNNNVITSTGTYSYTYQNVNGCDSTVTLDITINYSPTVNAGPDTTICEGSEVILNATGNADFYSWDNANTYPYLGFTTYTVTGENFSGCTSEDSFTVLVNNCDTTAGISENEIYINMDYSVFDMLGRKLDKSNLPTNQVLLKVYLNGHTRKFFNNN